MRLVILFLGLMLDLKINMLAVELEPYLFFLNNPMAAPSGGGIQKEEERKINKGPDFTPEEANELAKFPIPCAPTRNGQLVLRRCMAQKLCQFFLDTDPELEDAARAIYLAHPMW